MPTTEKSPEFYKHYPALFCAYFPVVNKEQLKFSRVFTVINRPFGLYGNSVNRSTLRLYKPKNACLLPLKYCLNNTVA